MRKKIIENSPEDIMLPYYSEGSSIPLSPPKESNPAKIWQVPSLILHSMVQRIRDYLKEDLDTSQMVKLVFSALLQLYRE